MKMLGMHETIDSSTGETEQLGIRNYELGIEHCATGVDGCQGSPVERTIGKVKSEKRKVKSEK